MSIYKILEFPLVYKLSQFILAPGYNQLITYHLKKRVNSNHLSSKRGVDIGCGPESLLNRIGLYPDGVDLCENYIRKFNNKAKSKGYLMSSQNLSFKDNEYDYAISIGLIHHLDDEDAKKTIQEMCRVVKPGGFVLIMDAILPQFPLLLFIPYIIRKLDRGKYVRNQKEWMELINNTWEVKRSFYSINLLETLIVWKKIKGDLA